MREKNFACATAGILDSLGAPVSSTAAAESKALFRPREVR